MKIAVTNVLSKKVHQILFMGLRRHNRRFGRRNHKDFTVTVTEGSQIIGGAIGESKFDWLILKLLWIDGRHRRGGIGSAVMEQVERLARTRRCRGIFLDTFSFQAPEFYKRHGFTVVGELKDHPIGHAKLLMAKMLDDRRAGGGRRKP